MKMRLFVVILVSLSVSGIVIASVEDASAAELLDKEKLELSLDGVAAATYGAEFPEDAEANYGPEVSLARLKLTGAWAELGEVKVQLGGATGDILLLDAVATLTALDPIEIRAGRFRTSVSSEVLIGAATLPMIDRALISGFVPRRLNGVETVGRFDVGDVTIQGQVGVFMPARGSFSDPEGQLLTGRLLVEFPAGIDVHVGYADLVFDDNTLEGADPMLPVADRRVLPYESPLDVAVTYEDERLQIHAESVQIFDPPEGDFALASYLQGGYRFGPSGQLQFEPTVAYDYVYDTESSHRIAGGLNLHFWDTGFYSTLNYRFRTGPLQEHSLFLRLTGAI